VDGEGIMLVTRGNKRNKQNILPNKAATQFAAPVSAGLPALLSTRSTERTVLQMFPAMIKQLAESSEYVLGR
jgi:hypothetical protein